MCAVITWLCMILIFHPKHNHTSTPDQDFLNQEEKQVSNQSDISGQASTLVFGHSQTGSDYTYHKTVHPLSQSGISSSQADDSAFQFGPLPTTPDHFRKNNSITSTAPSMTTLVSQMPKGSCGRSTKGSIDAGLQPIRHYEDLELDFIQDYVPPPLSPARKNRDTMQRTTERFTLTKETEEKEDRQAIMSFKEFGPLSHSTSSLLLPFEFHEEDTSGSTLGFLPPPPAFPPPLPL